MTPTRLTRLHQALPGFGAQSPNQASGFPSLWGSLARAHPEAQYEGHKPEAWFAGGVQ